MAGNMARYLVCITGASGAIYGLRLLKALARTEAELHVVASSWGQKVVLEESGKPLKAWLEELGPGRVEAHGPEDLSGPLASGSFRLDGSTLR